MNNLKAAEGDIPVEPLACRAPRCGNVVELNSTTHAMIPNGFYYSFNG